MTSLTQISANRSFGGWHYQLAYDSEALNSRTRFALFLPPHASADHPVPVLYWLSGLTCTDENMMQKAGAHRIAAELGIAIVAPDTSPRGDEVADDAEYDLGQGAGFYLDATQAPWSAHYRMERFVVEELPALIETHFPVSDRRAISGHSMGGHGALVLSLRHPGRYLSVSAFSPISHPSQVAWGQKAFEAYLGNDTALWHQHDATELLCRATEDNFCPTLVSQGLADPFLDNQLQPHHLVDAAGASGYPLTLEQHADYDHSYYFIATFIEQHLRFHQEVLNAR
ncbi:S-formylglutathione hydrolase [Ferrimonas balearica]|uniref:S-formylglutathione hydrolase n=1 Tax=Ferrimonas balearica TaxID=44012 RepID=UPI001C99BA3A|nr:S-formylglutathione hydrolase [Ferrimonas balearica]MBY5920243.1 S-formylglutathione hydrolase [Ferrimonas balearica]MBY5997072.1 S-formylglutathione hydrolase [Ferrimonas balearica]